MQNWKMALLASLGALLLGTAGPAVADDRGRDRSDRRIEHRFVDSNQWRHDRRGDRWDRRGDRRDWRHDRRGDRWDRRGDRRDWRHDKGRDRWDRRDWHKDGRAARHAARDRAKWERRADSLDRRADILRDRGRFIEADRFERQARSMGRRADRPDWRDGRRDGRSRQGPYIRWNSY
jgi:hypothetical protein